MAKVFDLQSEIHESPNRNTFDLTHKRHMTGKFGEIYPIFVHPVVPTDSFEIDTGIGINMMPMWYPTQSNMRFIVHYFYVPNRLLMKDWKNTIQGLEEHEFPYHNLPASWYKTGSLADHLGIPTNLVIPEESEFYLPLAYPREDAGFRVVENDAPFALNELGKSLLNRDTVPSGQLFKNFCIDTESPVYAVVPRNSGQVFGCISYSPLTHIVSTSDFQSFVLPFGFESLSHDVDNVAITMDMFLVYTDNSIPDVVTISSLFSDDVGLTFSSFHIKQTVTFPVGDKPYVFLSSSQCQSLNSVVSSHKYVFPLLFVSCSGENDFELSSSDFVGGSLGNFVYRIPKGEELEVATYSQYCPYYGSVPGDNNNKEKVRAFAARAYEMIYNAYYRNSHGNQPFVVDGQTKYNDYLISDAEGADSYPYALHSRNWELDAYTSCLPSPQQGDAPVISVNSVGTMRIQDADGVTSTLELRDMPDGVGVEVRSADIANPEHARLAASLSTSGMTIADFRHGNALTRFLEQSLRSGYRYADFIFGHFGKAPSHQELDMPVFLGGFTQNVDVSKISNVTASNDVDAAVLGQFAGTGAGFGVSQHGIKHYFDDFGIIMGVMMLVPDPAYSQVLPKHFTYTDRLNYYFPEFGQLGLQPVDYQELCPIQSFFEYKNGATTKLLTDTFGYQRPNHEYIWLPDTLHGQFRKSLNGSVINRRFGSRPVLGDEFLKIKPSECNEIFSVVEDDEDVFIGQVVIKISATRPIARVVVPSLGR